MVQERSDGYKTVTAPVDDELADRITDAVESNQELSESALVRNGLRRELEAMEAEQ